MGHFHKQERKIRKFTKLFKDTQIEMAFGTQNTMQNIVKQNPRTDKYKRGIYQMKCLDCPLEYMGQTGTAFHTRYKEHGEAIRNNNSNSGY
jgi:hypothetical protein